MKNKDINFKQTLKILEQEIKKKFTKFRYIIDSKIEEYEYVDSHDQDEFVPFSELRVFYPKEACYLGDLLKLKKEHYYNPGIKEALTHVNHLIQRLTFEEGISFFINLRSVEKDIHHRLEISYFQETKILSVLLVKTFCFGYLSPKKGVVVMKDF
jgi:hypothetical protein